MHEQQALSQSIPIASGNVHTPVTTTPDLAAHNYLVNLAISVHNITPAPRCCAGSGSPAPATLAPGSSPLTAPMS